MVLCVVVSLVFQIVYSRTMDDLSLWPRYFVIHYFFLMWLIALGFRALAKIDNIGRKHPKPFAQRIHVEMPRFERCAQPVQ